MEIYNFDYGIKFRNIAASTGIAVNIFYPVGTARLTYFSNLSFLVNDPLHYQSDFTFIRTDITLINNKGINVPLPASDDALFDLLASYLFSNIDPAVNQVSSISGTNYLLTASDNGKTFLYNVPPTAVKTFTIPAGLPLGLKCDVVKMFSSNSITFPGSGGMVVDGSDMILNGIYSKMQVLITGPTSALVFNIGG